MNRNIMLMSNTGGNIYNASYYCEFSAGDKAIFGILPEKDKPLNLAFVNSREQAKFALGLMFDAMKRDEEYFEFPQIGDLDDMMTAARQHGGKCTSRKVSHGGS